MTCEVTMMDYLGFKKFLQIGITCIFKRPQVLIEILSKEPG